MDFAIETNKLTKCFSDVPAVDHVDLRVKPELFSGAAGPRTEQLGLHSYVVVIFTGIIGLAATFYWRRNADQTR